MWTRMDFFQVGFLYIRRPTLFSKKDLGRFFTKDEIAALDKLRDELAQDVAEFSVFIADKKQSDRAQKSRDPELDAEIVELWHQLGDEGRLEHERSTKIAKKLRLTQGAINKRIRRLKLRTK